MGERVASHLIGNGQKPRNPCQSLTLGGNESITIFIACLLPVSPTLSNLFFQSFPILICIPQESRQLVSRLCDPAHFACLEVMFD